MAEYAFKLLSNSLDTETAINSILETVGKFFGVSRAYVFEVDEDGILANNTFGWCNEGIEAEIDVLQNLGYAEVNYEGLFSNGIFNFRQGDEVQERLADILAPQSIRTMLQCEMRINDMSRGFVGYDECFYDREWTQEQVNALKFISEILCTFLFRWRTQQRMMVANEDMRTMLDNQDYGIFIIDRDTHVVCYRNRKLDSMFPDTDILPGKGCNEAIFDGGIQCDNCPMGKLEAGVNTFTTELYLEKKNIYIMVNAAAITWEGRDAVMMTYHNISQYKQEISRL